MFPINKYLIYLFAFLVLAVSAVHAQSSLISPNFLKGEWVGSFSWKRDTTAYPTQINFRSPGICRLSIMDGKVHLVLRCEFCDHTKAAFVVDPDMSEPNPLFVAARLHIEKLSDYIPCVYRISFAFEGEEEQWGGYLFRIR